MFKVAIEFNPRVREIMEMASVVTRRVFSARPCLLALCAMFGLAPLAARAGEAAPQSFPFAIDGVYNEIETKYIFGFTDGADIGLEGEKAIESETNVAWRKRSGSYAALDQEVSFEHTPTQFITYELAVHGMAHAIKGVEGLDDLHRVNASGLSAKFSYLLIGRGPGSPIGLRFSVEPEWSRVDGTSGAHTRALGSTFKLVADTEFIANRLFGAINLIYAPEVSKAVGDDAWRRASTIGATAALAWRVAPKVTIGGEAEYYHAYDSLGFGAFQGRAVYLGPTLHVQIARKIMLAAAFSTQVGGHALADDRRLDLTNFSRHKARLKLEYEF
jgi:hypothetical protein